MVCGPASGAGEQRLFAAACFAGFGQSHFCAEPAFTFRLPICFIFQHMFDSLVAYATIQFSGDACRYSTAW
jgi:hypothetical protein